MENYTTAWIIDLARICGSPVPLREKVPASANPSVAVAMTMKAIVYEQVEGEFADGLRGHDNSHQVSWKRIRSCSLKIAGLFSP
jgi:hypothetical protein